MTKEKNYLPSSIKEIKTKYPKSEKGLMVDKYINKLKVQP